MEDFWLGCIGYSLLLEKKEKVQGKHVVKVKGRTPCHPSLVATVNGILFFLIIVVYKMIDIEYVFSSPRIVRLTSISAY